VLSAWNVDRAVPSITVGRGHSDDRRAAQQEYVCLRNRAPLRIDDAATDRSGIGHRDADGGNKEQGEQERADEAGTDRLADAGRSRAEHVALHRRGTRRLPSAAAPCAQWRDDERTSPGGQVS